MMNDEFRFACGEDFTGETVCVLKEDEVRLYGEYRTRRLVLEAWDRMATKRQRPVSTVEEINGDNHE